MSAVRSTVIADASFCHRTRAGGWAVWINVNWPDGSHRRIKAHNRFKRRARSSAHAEQMACMNGIWAAYQAGAREILVQTDCLEVVQSQGRTNSRKSGGEYLAAAAELWPEAALTWKHVKGHNLANVDDRRTFVNDWCDKQAKIHMRAQRDGG